jgi:hypothetical protein
MNMFNKLLAVEDRPKKLHGHGGGTYKAPKVKSENQKLLEENARLKAALQAILLGSPIDHLNRNDDGLVDYTGATAFDRPVGIEQLRSWTRIITRAMDNT